MLSYFSIDLEQSALQLVLINFADWKQSIATFYFM